MPAAPQKLVKRAKAGRPTIMTSDVISEICDRLAGGESLRRICLDERMPARATVLEALRNDEDFQARYAQAREDQAEYHHDEMEEIEHEVRTGALDPKAANVILGNKRWRMEKLKPKSYGQKMAVEHSGKLSLESLVAE